MSANMDEFGRRKYYLPYADFLAELAALSADSGASSEIKIIRDEADLAALDEPVRTEFSRSHADALIYVKTDRGEYTILPPFPLRGGAPPADLGELRAQFAKPYSVGLLLLRLGRYAAGISVGGELVASKTSSVYVKGKHKKGGQSSMRFTRNRTMWIQKLFDTAAAEFDKLRTAHAAPLDYVFLFGDKIVIKQFLNRAEFAAQYAPAEIAVGKVEAKFANLQTLRATTKTLSSARVIHHPNL